MYVQIVFCFYVSQKGWLFCKFPNGLTRGGVGLCVFLSVLLTRLEVRVDL